MQKVLLPRLIGSVAGLAMMTGAALAQESVEVLHWWTSGGEAAALNVLKQNLEKEGVAWKDMPVAGGGGTEAMTVLRSRATSGNPPTAAQMLGYDILDWAELGVVGNLDDLAAEEGWDEVIPAALQNFSKYDGHWIAAPVNIHSTNWMWASKAVLDKAGVSELPTDWDSLVAALDKIKASGVTPIAHGGQAWQDATVFEAVVVTTGGPDFYKKALNDFDPEALGSDTMKQVFDRMTQLKGYFDPNFSGRDWNLSTAMVMNGEAGIQFMGDWAKGEFINAGKVPGTDFVCARFPGTQGTVLFNADQFVMFAVGDDKLSAQKKLASAIEDPSFQVAFNKVKGSVPARTDISDAEFDDCAKKGMADLAEASSAGTLFGSLAHGHGAPAAVKNAVYDVVTRHLNGEIASSDEAVTALVDAVAAAQ
ncbi:MAG TPA: ABC transporter substrate-binding protein [Propylenella sp.]